MHFCAVQHTQGLQQRQTHGRHPCDVDSPNQSGLLYLCRWWCRDEQRRALNVTMTGSIHPVAPLARLISLNLCTSVR